MPLSVEEEIRQLRSLFWSERDPEGRVFAPLADAYRRSGDLTQALDLLEEGLVRQMDFVPGHVVSGWVRRDRGDSQAAVIAFRAALALDAENAEAARGLAELGADGRGSSAQVTTPPAPAAATVQSEPPPATPAATDDGPVTRTMADLYARQGLHDRALKVYRRLLERDPADESLAQRVAELGALAGGSRGREVDVETLARDWASGPGDTGELSTPFAWTPALKSQPERRSGPAARDYFRGLLAWEPGASATSATEPPVTAASSAADEMVAPPTPQPFAQPERIPQETPERTVVPIAALAPELAEPTEAAAVTPTLDAAPEQVVAIASLAPDTVAIASLAPDAVAIASLAPDAVPIASLAPSGR